jgi:hypothetical protein
MPQNFMISLLVIMLLDISWLLLFTLVMAIMDVNIITDDVFAPLRSIGDKIIIYYITLDTNIIDSFDSK